MKLSKWEDLGEQVYVGQTIVGIRYMTAEEARRCGFYNRPPVLVLSNGLEIAPLQDDEANDGGALGQMFTNPETGERFCSSVLPVASMRSEEYVSLLSSAEKEKREDHYIRCVVEECNRERK